MAPDKIFCLQISVKDFVVMKAGKHIDILQMYILWNYLHIIHIYIIIIYVLPNCFYKLRNTVTFYSYLPSHNSFWSLYKHSQYKILHTTLMLSMYLIMENNFAIYHHGK